MSARPFLAMDWRDVLFLHWPVDVRELQPRIPADLEIDTYAGTAWVSIAAFRIAAARPAGFPAAIASPSFAEVNVRTYVRGPLMDGVWFFSLDAASPLAVAGGRRIVQLPYFNARIDAKWTATECRYRSERRDRRSGAARFAASARFGGDVRIGAPDSLDAWLVERYCFYTVDPHGNTLRGDVRHAPWLLRDATAEVAQNALLSTAGITPQTDNPLVHVSPGVAVRAWSLASPAVS